MAVIVGLPLFCVYYEPSTDLCLLYEGEEKAHIPAEQLTPGFIKNFLNNLKIVLTF